MRKAIFSVLAIATGMVALPHLAFAAHSIPFFGPIIEKSMQNCPLGWGAVIEVVNNIITVLLSLAIVFVAPIMIAYAGFLFVVNPVNASGREKAKKVLINTISGIVIALCAWLIVDAVMVTLTGGSFGSNWVNLITTGSSGYCLPQAGAPGA